jgi:hypothetical protein
MQTPWRAWFNCTWARDTTRDQNVRRAHYQQISEHTHTHTIMSGEPWYLSWRKARWVIYWAADLIPRVYIYLCALWAGWEISRRADAFICTCGQLVLSNLWLLPAEQTWKMGKSWRGGGCESALIAADFSLLVHACISTFYVCAIEQICWLIQLALILSLFEWDVWHEMFYHCPNPVQFKIFWGY